jgi:phosphotransferase system HPr (HPr) family protein
MFESSDTQRAVRLPEGIDLHARPAGLLVRTASAYQSAITLSAGDKCADAKSILQVLALGATGGSEVAVAASGSDASEALEAVSSLLATLS